MSWSFWRERAPALVGLALLLSQAWQTRPAAAALPARRSWTFPTQGIASVRLAAFHATESTGNPSERPATLTISGRPRLLPNGPHSRELEGHEKPAEEWHFTWALQRTGDTMELRALGEVLKPNCRFYLDEVEVRVPAGTSLKLEKLPLSPN